MSPKRSTITYSKANITKFPTRKTFADAVVNSFTLSGRKPLSSIGPVVLRTTSGQHYHMFYKLPGPTKWNLVKNHLTSNHQIVVNFSESHETYYAAYQYVCKKDMSCYPQSKLPWVTGSWLSQDQKLGKGL